AIADSGAMFQAITWYTPLRYFRYCSARLGCPCAPAEPESTAVSAAIQAITSVMPRRMSRMNSSPYDWWRESATIRQGDCSGQSAGASVATRLGAHFDGRPMRGKHAPDFLL